MTTTQESKEIGSIHENGKNRYILKEIKYVNKRAQQIIGFHECWHKWMPSRQEWTVTPSYYVKVV